MLIHTFLFLFLIVLTYHISSLDPNPLLQNSDFELSSSSQPSFTSDLFAPQNTTFEEFKLFQNKVYISRDQETYRMLVFQSNLAKINSHNNNLRNQTYSNGFVPFNQGFKMKVNKFSDLSERQFRQIYTKTYPSTNIIMQKTGTIIKKQNDLICNCATFNFSSNSFILNNSSKFQTDRQIQINSQISNLVSYSEQIKLQSSDLRNAQINTTQFNTTSFNTNGNTSLNTSQIKGKSRKLQQTTLPLNISIDWTKHSGQVKYQGLCGACYAFAAADALSALNSIFKFGFFIPLSIQQIIDCSSQGLTYGCNGGFIQGSYAYIQSSGITTEFAYKYQAKQAQCKIQKGTFKVSSFKAIQKGSCSSLISQLSKKPISIGIAGYRLQFYSSGVFDDCNSYIDHAVVLIGYKSGSGWKIKNSWGSDWGMSGYAWIKEGNNCGICQNAISASIPQETIESTP